MRKRCTFVALILAMVACSREEAVTTQQEPEVEPGYKVLTIQASQSDFTKTSYANDKAFSWSVGDEISVLCHNGEEDFWQTFKATTAAATSTFTATVPSGVTTGNSSGNRAAMYPASSEHGTSFWGLSFHIPAERDFRASSGGHTSAAIPMMAIGTDSDSYSFVNLTGAAKFSFTGLSCQSVKFVFTVGSVKLNGSYNVFDYNETSAVGARWNAANAGSESEKTVTYYGDVVDGKVSFYLPYATGGIWGYSTLTLTNAETGAVLYSHDHVGTINITQNQVVVLPAIDLSGGNPLSGTNLTFTETTADIANPERGFYDPNEFIYKGGSKPSSLYNLQTGNTLVLVEFMLEDFIEEDHISDAVVTKIRSVFDKVRTAKRKAIVRFAYTDDEKVTPHGASIDRILNHIGDVKSILQDNADIIYVVQAGFVGTWGEWYYVDSDSFPKISVSSGKVKNFETRAQVIDALLEAVPETRQVAMRTPLLKRYYVSPDNVNSWTPISAWDGTDPNSRLSFHNDGYLADANDIGTFESQRDHDMWDQQSAYLAIGGETAYQEVDETYAALAPAKASITRQHYSYLNSNDENEIMAYWIQKGVVSDIRKALGYRLSLTAGILNYTTLTAGSTLDVQLTMKNSGCVSVIYPRRMKLVLIQGSSYEVLADLGDVRCVTPDSPQSFKASVTLPKAVSSGDKLALWLPDTAESLASEAAYSIRLANNETTWSSGYNIFYTF